MQFLNAAFAFVVVIGGTFIGIPLLAAGLMWVGRKLHRPINWIGRALTR